MKAEASRGTGRIAVKDVLCLEGLSFKVLVLRFWGLRVLELSALGLQCLGLGVEG